VVAESGVVAIASNIWQHELDILVNFADTLVSPCDMTFERNVVAAARQCEAENHEMWHGEPRKASERVRVAVVSPVCLSREGLRAVIESDTSMEVTHAVGPFPSSIDSLAGATLDVVVVDASSREGLAAISPIRRIISDVPMVAYGIPTTPGALFACARGGATLVASRDLAGQQLREMILTVAVGRLEGELRLNAALLGELATLAHGDAPTTHSSLTRRERELAVSVVYGLTNKEIAEQLCISLPTVKSHVHRVLLKLGVRRRNEVLSHLIDHPKGGHPD